MGKLKWLIIVCVFLSACNKTPEPLPVADFLLCKTSLTAVFVSSDEVHLGTRQEREEYLEKVFDKMKGGQPLSADNFVSVIRLDTCSLDWFNQEDYPGKDFAVKIVEGDQVDMFMTSLSGMEKIIGRPFEDVNKN